MLKVYGEPYNVKERMIEEGNDHTAKDLDSEWFEYEINLLNDMGQVVASWDSRFETYNGVQKLSLKDCKEAIKNIKKDIEVNGIDPKNWFTT